ncbi:short-subunit dehydrogenase [Anseongella ginsenosidimutans]|uniref:Short-subunit dehydrogenase n=1 Tax=Anseongella ginsenosidimutans TaxID=496056 RepID=A0A4R3KTQ9_9SPHI|nr:SDR family oxidoreductase [Anseongella ginsenosidimutans]QEC53291.1 SDR family oxidoreductase [Anseongella ginsenosidimutans]TCS88163.1 short-subunit dehydrogenase [Anseongella ginsenosidimutans]
MELKGKTVLITGASSGIGKACAERFAEEGANLVLGARQYVALCAITRELEEKYGIRAVAVQTDVSREEDCRLFVEQALSTFGGIDVLVNNAGISMRALFRDLDLAVLRKVMDVNFWGTVYCTKYALPAIIESRGSVVGVSSIAGYKGLPGRTGYSASKFAVQGFMESLRIENLRKGVHVMVACPGFTASNIRNTALVADGSLQGRSSMEEGSMMSAEEVAGLIVRGVQQRRRDLIITGQGRLTVFMSRFFPKLTDRLVYKHFTKEKDPLIK